MRTAALHLRVRRVRAAGSTRSNRIREAARRIHDPRRAAGETIGSLPRRVGPRGLPHPDGRVRAHHRRPGTAPAGMGLRALPADDLARFRRQGSRAVRHPRHGKPARRSRRVSRRSEVALRYDAGLKSICRTRAPRPMGGSASRTLGRTPVGRTAVALAGALAAFGRSAAAHPPEPGRDGRLGRCSGMTPGQPALPCCPTPGCLHGGSTHVEGAVTRCASLRNVPGRDDASRLFEKCSRLVVCCESPRCARRSSRPSISIFR